MLLTTNVGAKPPMPKRAAQLPSTADVRPTVAANGSAEIGELLAPVRAGLKLVDAKMKAVDSSVFAPLANAFVGLIGSGGKRLRPALALLAAEFNGSLQDTPDYERVVALAASVEMLHTATLVHDDVIDGALLRRGAPTLNARWSGGSTVLAGNHMFGTAARFSAETQNMRVIRCFSDTLRIIVDGELRQLQDRHNFRQAKENYYQRIYAKTASLFCAATEGAAALTRLPEERIRDLRDYGYNFGMAFQIVDDILDFTGDEMTLGKPAGSDLRQGTLTLPFFYFLQQSSEAAKLVAQLESAQDEAEMGDPQPWNSAVDEIVHAINASSAVDAAFGEARMFLRRASDNLAAFGDNPYRRSMLGLCEFVVARSN